MIPVLWVLFVIAVGIYICSPLVDPDLWWHTIVGRWIISHGEVPRVEHWNAYHAGKPWVAYSWSNEIFYGLADKLAGYEGLVVLQFVLAIFLAFAICLSYSYISSDYFLGLLFGSFATASLVNNFSLRPQSFVYILLAALLANLEWISRKGANHKNLLCITILMSLWANSHITTVFGIMAVILWIDRKEDLLRTVLVTALFAFIGTILTPYLGKEWWVFFGKSGHPFLYADINEMRPATITSFGTAFLACFLSLLAAIAWRTGVRLPARRLVFTLAMVLGGLTVVKFLPFSLISLGALLVQAIAMSKSSELHEAITKLRVVTKKFCGCGLGFFLIVCCVVLASKILDAPLMSDKVPVAAVDYIIDHKLEGPILNAFGEGGYMMYRLADAEGNLKEQVPLDGRTNVNPPLLAKYNYYAFNGTEHWRKLIELVKPKTIIWKNVSPFVALLLESKDWCRVFKNGAEADGFSVFVACQK